MTTVIIKHKLKQTNKKNYFKSNERKKLMMKLMMMTKLK